MRRGLVRETASDCGAVVVFGGAFGGLTVLLGAFGFFPQRQDLIFPLLDLGGQRSPHVEPVMAALREDGCEVSVVRVGLSFSGAGTA